MISNIFDENFGTIYFLTSTIAERKLFHEANAHVFTIWIKLLKYYGNTRNKFESHVISIIEICIKYIQQADNVSAKEREKAVQVLQEIFQNKLVSVLNFDVAGEILKVFNIKRRPATLTSQVFRLLGIIAKQYKHLIALYEESLRNIYMKTIEDNILNEENVSLS